MVYDRESNAPDEKVLRELGFDEMQILLVKQLPPYAQWEVHDEFIRRLMSSDESDMYDW